MSWILVLMFIVGKVKRCNDDKASEKAHQGVPHSDLEKISKLHGPSGQPDSEVKKMAYNTSHINWGILIITDCETKKTMNTRITTIFVQPWSVTIFSRICLLIKVVTDVWETVRLKSKHTRKNRHASRLNENGSISGIFVVLGKKTIQVQDKWTASCNR